MKNLRLAIFGGVLIGLVVFAVSGLVAQTRSEPKADVRVGPRVMALSAGGGQLGVRVRDLDEAAAKKAAGATSGVTIEEVRQESPAAKAGLLEGDIILDVDGDRVRSARQFARLIREAPEGKSVKLGIVRNGTRQSVDVTPQAADGVFNFDFGERLGRDMMRDIQPRLREFRYYDGRPFSFDFDLPRMGARGRLGVQLSDLPPQLAEYFGVPEGGALVASVTRDSAAEKAGLKAGDVITSLNGDRVRNHSELIDELRDVSGEVTIGIMRDKKASSLKATLEAPSTPRRMSRR